MFQNGPSGWPLTSSASEAAEEAEQHRVDVEQARHHHQREEARHDEVLDRVDAEHLQRVELLAHLARAEVGGDRRARHAGEHDRGDQRADFADRREHEEPAEAVERAEEREEVRRLQPRRAVADRDRRDQQRQPAQPQREQELRDELAAVGVGRAQGRDDRPARQDHHVPEFLEHDASSGGKTRSAALRTISAFPSSGDVRRPRSNSTPCAPGTPPAAGIVAATVRARGDLALLRDVPAAACCAALCSRSAILAGCGGGSPPGRRRTERHLPRRGRQRELPRAAGGRAAERRWYSVRNTGTQTVPNVAVTSTPSTTRATIPELASNKRPIWVIERGPGAIADPPGRERGSQPARRRPDGLRQHLGARPARARAHAHVRLARGAGEGRRYTVHYTVAAGLSGKARARARATAAPRSGTSPSTIAPTPAGHARRPRHRRRSIPGPRLLPRSDVR